MKHYDEEILEQFALNPGMLGESIQTEIRLHIKDCSLCLGIFNYFADFFEEFHETLDRTPPEVDEFVAGLYPVIPISNINIREPQEPAMYVTVLAAMSAARGNDRFRSVATLASEEQRAVVRILQDNSTNKLRMYVITDDPGKRSYALLSFPEISADFVTDRNGQIEVDFPHSNWNHMKGVLRLAVAEHNVETQNLLNENGGNYTDLNGGLHSVSVAYQDKKLHITTSKKKNYAPDLNIAVVSGENDLTYFIPLQNGTGECVIASLPESLALRLYC